MDDSVRIRQAQRGDAVALARVLQANYLAVKKYLITVTLDRNLAEDLTQETMIRAIQKIGQFSGRSKFSTWLISIATHLYMDVLRSRQRERRCFGEVFALLTDSGDGPGPEWQDMLSRLAELPRDVALPLVLKHYHGYTYEEIAQWLQIPVGTVKSRIFNAIRSLRKELAENDTP